MKDLDARIYAQTIYTLLKDSKDIGELVITKPCVDSAYFKKHDFKEEEPNVYTKTEVVFTQNPMTGQATGALERVIKFKIYDVDPYLGTNIEFFIDNKQQNLCSGYFTDFNDFQTMFKI